MRGKTKWGKPIPQLHEKHVCTSNQKPNLNQLLPLTNHIHHTHTHTHTQHIRATCTFWPSSLGSGHNSWYTFSLLANLPSVFYIDSLKVEESQVPTCAASWDPGKCSETFSPHRPSTGLLRNKKSRRNEEVGHVVGFCVGKKKKQTKNSQDLT